MPRKSAADLAIVPRLADHHRRITAPPECSPGEAALFKTIVESCHPLHFSQADAPLLRAYVQACLLSELAFASAQQSPDALGDWERCVRVQAALSVKLRLNPHSRADPKTVMRTVAGHSLREIGVTPESLAAIRDGSGARDWTARG